MFFPAVAQTSQTSVSTLASRDGLGACVLWTRAELPYSVNSSLRAAIS